jgi:hypothetical protein
MSSSRSAATDRFIVATMSSKECSGGAMAHGYPVGLFPTPARAGRATS